MEYGCRIESALMKLGWKRAADKLTEDFKLKWVEVKVSINYEAFREGSPFKPPMSFISAYVYLMKLVRSISTRRSSVKILIM